MKNKLKNLLLILLIIPMMLIFSACDPIKSNEVISIEKTSSIGLVDTYTITYENGKTYCFKVTNGSNGSDGVDGQSYDINDIYEAAQEAGFQGDFLNFIDAYLDYDEDLKTMSINKSLLSVVSVYSNFTGIQTYIQMGKPYEQVVEYSSAGSGVIYSLDKEKGNAYIITNYHVIYDVNSNQENGISDDISVYLYGYENKDCSIDVTFFGGSMDYDIAILKIEDNEILKNSDARAVDVSDSNEINIGESAIAIGNPEALGISATSGIVSVDSEYISMTRLDGKFTTNHRVLRIDTAVNGGNSGGGLFNSDGKLIGIVNAKISDEEIENIAYAIPSNIATYIAENIINNNGQFKRLILGISLDVQNTKSIYNANTKMVDINEDVIIAIIQTDSLASELGFNINDKIISVSINDEKIEINRMFEVIDYLYKAKTNDSIIINIERNSAIQEISFVVSAEDLKVY